MAELDVLVVDCQTTGASPAFGRVLEVGLGVLGSKAEPLAAQAHFIELPRGYRLSKQVRKLTGYDPVLVEQELSEEQAWRLVEAAAQQALARTVIHYARFEVAFLKDWSQRFSPQSNFPLDVVCTHAIAKRLHPELPRYTLRALAGFLGHSLQLERRALGHVCATAFVWRRLAEQLIERGVHSWEDLVQWLAEPAPKSIRGKHKYPIEPEAYRRLPQEPGVYRLLRSNGDVLYVGKAARLKQRVSSHFTGRASKALAPEMLTQVSAIDFEVSQSPLEAALCESDTIKAEQPPYNVQLAVNEAPLWYSSREFLSALPRPDREHCIGPLAWRETLRPLAAVRALLEGAVASSELVSSVIVAPLPPQPAVFLAGWDEFLARHAPQVAGAGRAGLLRLAALILTSETAAPDEEAPATSEAGSWDSARVVRHIERALAQSYRGYRRARWLSLVHWCEVLYREPGSGAARLLQVQDARVVLAADAALDQGMSGRRPRQAKPPAWDRARYDRLRILSSELKRILRDGGQAVVRWGPGRALTGAALVRALSVV